MLFCETFWYCEILYMQTGNTKNRKLKILISYEKIKGKRDVILKLSVVQMYKKLALMFLSNIRYIVIIAVSLYMKC